MGQEFDVVEERHSCSMLYPRVLLHILPGIRVLIILFSSHICFDLSIPLVLCMFLSTSDIIILCSFSVSNMFLHFPGLCFWELQYASRYFRNFPIPSQIYLFSVMKRGRRRCDTQGADCGFSIRAHL